MKRNNPFITSALEELQQEQKTTDGENGGSAAGAQSTDGVTAAGITEQQKQAAVTAGEVTEVNIDSSTDAVAELMEQNAQLATENDELQTETFDNDVDFIENTSDSVNKDLNEAVQAGIALEELAHIAGLTANGGFANKGSVAALAFGLEQICARADIQSPATALEANELALIDSKDQAEAIGDAAKSKAKEIKDKLVAGIKRLIGWITNVIRNMLAGTSKVAERAAAAKALVASIDESKTISGSFINSLRLVEGGGDANQQFEEYAKLTTKTLYGFFSDSFIANMNKVLHQRNEAKAVAAHSKEIARLLMSTSFTEHGNGSDVPNLPDNVKEADLTVGKTVPCVGGSQLYLAATLAGEDDLYIRAGLAKNQPKIAEPETIPTVQKQLANSMLELIQRWMKDQKELESRLRRIEGYAKQGEDAIDMSVLSNYMRLLAAVSTGILPHFLRLNLQNASRFVAYVEKSAAVSKGEKQ